MIRNAELLRTVRQGGPEAILAAKELLVRAEQGAVSNKEMKALWGLVLSPEMSAMFSDSFRDQTASILASMQVAPEVAALVPQLETVVDLRQLPLRFAADLSLVQANLIGFPGLASEAKAERLIAFFGFYAEHAVGLRLELRPEVKVTDDGLWAATLLEFRTILKQANFHQMRDAATGVDGLVLAMQLFDAPSRQEVVRRLEKIEMTAPTWEANPKSIDKVLQAEAPNAKTPSLLMPSRSDPRTSPDGSSEPKRDLPARRGMLGRNMVWNLLHRFRSLNQSELDEAHESALRMAAVVGLVSLAVTGTLLYLLFG